QDLVTTVAAIVTLVIGIGGLSASLLLWWRVRQADSYLPVPARIVERSVGGVLGGPGGSSYGPKVKYAYTVDGREFVGDRYGYFSRGYSVKRAREALAAIPDELTVYVSPSDPTQAVIDRSGKGVAALCGCAGVVIVLIALVIFAS